jgi:hypothetical protein
LGRSGQGAVRIETRIVRTEAGSPELDGEANPEIDLERG